MEGSLLRASGKGHGGILVKRYKGRGICPGDLACIIGITVNSTVLCISNLLEEWTLKILTKEIAK